MCYSFCGYLDSQTSQVGSKFVRLLITNYLLRGIEFVVSIDYILFTYKNKQGSAFE